MGRDEEIQFEKLLAAVAREALLQQRPDGPDAIPRALGLIFVIKLAPVDPRGNGSHAFWANNVQAAYLQIEQSLFGIFNGLFQIDRGPGPLAYGKMRLSSLAAPSLFDLHPGLSRFLTLRIAGVTFDTLNRLQKQDGPGRNPTIYDFAYDLQARFNATLARNQAQIYVDKVAPDPPYHFTCHPEPNGDSPYGAWWPHDAKHMGIVDAWHVDHPSCVKKYGEGVLVGHLDTGWSNHPALKGIGERLRLDLQYNAVDDTKNASDPLNTSLFNGEPAHGTTTATIIASASPDDPERPIDLPRGVLGVATRSQIVPILVCNGTAFVCNSHVARGLSHAIDVGCHVVSMSVGGLFVPGFEELAQIARSRNMLLVAAAGNCVWLVVYPARFDQCLAVGGSTDDNGYWQYAPHDFCVDVAAPGFDVRTTLIKPKPPPPFFDYDWGSGTSYSTAYVAGIAALWRAFFYGSCSVPTATPLQTTFAKSVKTHVNVPSGWSTWFQGTGIASAYKLLHDGPNVELRPDDRSLEASAAQAPDLAPGASEDGLPVLRAPEIDDGQSLLRALGEILYQSTGKSPDMLANARKWFAAKSDAETMRLLDRYGGEMVNLILGAAGKDKENLQSHASKTSRARLAWAFELFRTEGSKALRGALDP